jgi:hypothetical protein
VTSRTTGWSRRPRRIGIEVVPRAQPNQKLRSKPFEPLLELYGIVAGVEDEKRGTTNLLALIQPFTHGSHLPYGDLVLVVGWMQTPEIPRGNPPIALEAQLGDKLVDPASDDGLAGRMPGRMVVETPFGLLLASQ